MLPEDYEDETTPPELNEPEFDEPFDFRDDVEADADALRGIGWGTDEDYGSANDEPW